MKQRKFKTKVISVASGKGGVGKSTVVTNIAVALAQQARKVLVLDADLGLANVDILLGVKPAGTIEDVVCGRKTLAEIVVQGPAGVSIVPAASGVEQMERLSDAQRMALFEELEALASSYEYLIIDTEAGIGADVMFFSSAAHECIVVINDEPTSLTDAYGFVKVLTKNYGARSVKVIVNAASHTIQGERTFDRFAAAVARHLSVKVSLLGIVPHDGAVKEAVISRQPLVTLFPSSRAAIAITKVASELESHAISPSSVQTGSVKFFLSRLLETPMAAV